MSDVEHLSAEALYEHVFLAPYKPLTPEERVLVLRLALQTFLDEAPSSVEFSDWPELQNACEYGRTVMDVTDPEPAQ